MVSRVRIKDDRRGMDELKADLKKAGGKHVVIGITNQAGGEVLNYANANEFGATIKARSFTVTTYKKLRKGADTRSAFDKYGNKRKTHLNKGRFVTRHKAETGKGFYMREEHAASHNGFKIPSRPFMRSYYDENLKKIGDFATREFLKVIRQGQSSEQAFNRIGLYVQNGVKHRIRTSPQWAVPNAPSTIKKKGSAKPLVDHGIMINSVTFDIRRGR